MINLPTSITIFRIFLVPVLVVLILTKWEPLIGVAVFLVAAFTDYLDGYLARKRGEVTAMGKLLDPIADKLLMSAAFISLVEVGAAPAWIVVIVVGRELAVSGLRQVAATKGVAIGASVWGKFKTGSQVLAVVLLILGEKYLQEFAFFGNVALWVVLALAVLSAWDYFRKFSRGLGLLDRSEGA
jgi:CDP-diacylglycerol--glycerol-3-phosphate 3-phosphatidyltransferase